MKYILYIVILVVIVGCEIFDNAHVVRKMYSETILFPAHTAFTIQGDTIDFHVDSTHYKILVYVNSVGCTTCKFPIPQWKRFLQQINGFSEVPISYLFSI